MIRVDAVLAPKFNNLKNYLIIVFILTKNNFESNHLFSFFVVTSNNEGASEKRRDINQIIQTLHNSKPRAETREKKI